VIRDVTTGKALSGPNEFTDSLHHRSWIVQTEQLKYHRRTDLEKLLSIFDQENRTRNHHILNVDEDNFPEKYRPIIRRLRMASESEDMQIEMEMEDDYLKELQDKERAIEEKDKTIEEQGKALAEQGKALKEKDEALAEQGETIEEQEKALEEKDRAIEELRQQLAALRK
jgi:DNA repair exonuclease SbcCD ATPase subunit